MAIRPHLITLLCSLAALRLAGASATPEKLNGLLSNSPFGTARSSPVAGTGTGDPLEFRAVLEENGTKLFSIYDTATRHSTWVEVNDPVNGFAVKAYDAALETITIEYQQKSLTLPIKRAPAVAQAAQPSALPGGPVPIPTLTGPNAMSPVDQQRLQQVQEEIRRRRALRQQPAVPGGEGGPRPMPPGVGGAEAGPQWLPPNAQNAPYGPQPIPVKN